MASHLASSNGLATRRFHGHISNDFWTHVCFSMWYWVIMISIGTSIKLFRTLLEYGRRYFRHSWSVSTYIPRLSNAKSSRSLAAILPTTFSNSFACMKVITFQFIFHWNWITRVQLTISLYHSSDNGSMPSRWQVIIWIIDLISKTYIYIYVCTYIRPDALSGGANTLKMVDVFITRKAYWSDY